MAFGTPHQVAKCLGFDAADTTTAPAGTTQAGATPLTSTITAPTSAGNNTGYLLPSADAKGPYIVFNNGSNTLKVYPNGTAQINLLGASAAFSISANKTCVFYPDGTNWYANMSA
jgi:hypothetical protein